MDESQWLLLASCGLGLYAVGQVWLVQLATYPPWVHVGEREFHAYHAAWWHSIWGVILAPAGLLMVCAALMMWWRAPGVPAWATWLGGALQAALLLGTVLWWGPVMARLETCSGGLSREHYKLLIRTHWIRVGIVSAYGILGLWMLAESAWRA